jgi:hypothetical protein
MKFKTKPFEIEAVRFDGENFLELYGFCGWEFADLHGTDKDGISAQVHDKLHATWVGVKAGQWIIKGAKGEFYPCDPEIFEAKYEPVEITRENIGELMLEAAMRPVDE